MAKKAKKRKPTPAQIAYYNRNKGRKKATKKSTVKNKMKGPWNTALLNERDKTHGGFRINSSVSQRIKDIIRGEPTYANLSAPQKESLDMIAHKISRIIAGDPNFADHWDDLAGYAKLPSEIITQDAAAAAK